MLVVKNSKLVTSRQAPCYKMRPNEILIEKTRCGCSYLLNVSYACLSYEYIFRVMHFFIVHVSIFNR